MEEKTKSHDRVLAECFQYLWNVYPDTRKTMFHVTNESKPVDKSWLKDLLIVFCKYMGVYIDLVKLNSFLNLNLYGKSHLINLSRQKAIGVVAGVLDLIWYWKGVMYCFDVKVGTDKFSKDQKEFIRVVEENGGKCFEINNFDMFKIIVDEIIKSWEHQKEINMH
jgi:hypothetical protein